MFVCFKTRNYFQVLAAPGTFIRMPDFSRMTEKKNISESSHKERTVHVDSSKTTYDFKEIVLQ